MGNDRGDGYPADGEGPVHPVHLDDFGLDPLTVTNARFAAFADATGHVTEAERYGWSFVFGGLLPDDFPPTRAVAQAPWWRQVYGADWRHPEGPHSDVDDRMDHPVVHVSWNDAVAYCAWAGGRLPTEAEWEHAARGGLDGQPFPWGAELEPGGEHRMNVFQGRFPAENTCADGYAATAPAGAYPPNGYGLHQMTGNVWEWVGDWFDAGYYAASPVADPRGPAAGDRRVMRGGSYLCHASYCNRYRVDARSANTPDSSAGNIGFRVAYGPHPPVNVLLGAVILVVAAAAAIAVMLLVRRRAPEGSYFSDGDRASGVFGVLATGFSVLLGFIIFLAFTSYDQSRSGAETEALVVTQQVETAQLMPRAIRADLTGQLVCYARTRRRAGVGPHGGRHAGGRDQPVGDRALRDAAQRGAGVRERGVRLRQVARPDVDPRGGPPRPHPRRRGRDTHAAVDRAVRHLGGRLRLHALLRRPRRARRHAGLADGLGRRR